MPTYFSDCGNKMSDEELLTINKWLKLQGVESGGRPMYRIVWSETQFENRFGVFKYFPDPRRRAFIEVTEVRKMKKYPYIHDKYVFEKWAPGNIAYNAELPDSGNGDYLPVFAFQDGQCNPLPVTQRAAAFIVNCLEGKVDKSVEPDEETLLKMQEQQMFEEIDNHPYFSTHGDIRDTVAYTKEYGEKYGSN